MATEAAELIDTEASSTLDALRASGRTVNATKDLGDGLGSLAGKVVLITWASRGFGRAYATKLALLGAKVFLSDENSDATSSVITAVRAARGIVANTTDYRNCDYTSAAELLNLFDNVVRTFRAIDFVVIGAGKDAGGEEYGQTFELDQIDNNLRSFKSPYTTQIYRDVTGALGTSFVMVPEAPAYTIAKHGTLGLFKLIAALGQPQNISTSLIVPWYPDVPLVEDRYLKAEPIPRRILDKGISGMLYATVNSDADGQLVLIHARGVVVAPYMREGEHESGSESSSGKSSSSESESGESSTKSGSRRRHKRIEA